MPQKRQKIRRTSSLPGLATDNLVGYTTYPTEPQQQPPPTQPQYNFTFTTNLTPSTFQHADKNTSANSNNKDNNSESVPTSLAESPSSISRKRGSDAIVEDFYTDKLPKRKEDAHTRKFSEGHIPRPPNAFILFRSDLVARKAVPTSLEADHSTISKIIGVCWRTLPARQRKRWEQKALEAKAAHKKLYPDYRYTPVHRKGPQRKKPKKEQKKDDQRCEELAQLLLSGHKGADLEAQVKKLDTHAGGIGGSGEPTQYTFVPSAFQGSNGATLSATPGQAAAGFDQPRRHSSAPPTDGHFEPPQDGSSSSTPQNLPLALHQPQHHLPSHHFDPHAYLPAPSHNVSPTSDEVIPLSRLSRKLPTHKMRPMPSTTANYPSVAMHPVPSKKTKSSISKQVKAKGNGRFVPESERNQLFIQSVWTSAAVGETDPSLLIGENGKRIKKARKGVVAGAIPNDLVLAPWDAGAAASTSSGYTYIPDPQQPQTPITTEDKYVGGNFDAGFLAGFDSLTTDFGVPSLDTGFDFGSQFAALDVDENNKEEFDPSTYNGYYYPTEFASAPTSASGTSPHSSEAEDVAAYHSPTHPYHSHPAPPPVFTGAPDWSAFDTTPPARQPGTPVDPLHQPYGTFHHDPSSQYEFYPPLPDSAPGSEHGGDTTDPAELSPHLGAVYYPPPPQQTQLPPAGYGYPMASPTTTDIAEQLGHLWMEPQQSPQQPPSYYAPAAQHSGFPPAYHLPQQDWADWTHPDPFAQQTETTTNQATSVDPLTPATHA